MDQQKAKLSKRSNFLLSNYKQKFGDHERAMPMRYMMAKMLKKKSLKYEEKEHGKGSTTSVKSGLFPLNRHRNCASDCQS